MFSKFENIIRSRKRIRIPAQELYSFESLLLFDHIFFAEEREVWKEECYICCDPLEELSDAVYLRLCRHKFHLHCLRKLFQSAHELRCPLCMKHYEHLYPAGAEFKSGVLDVEVYRGEVKMTFQVEDYHCLISLDDNKENKFIMKLLIKAWLRYLLNKDILQSFVACSRDELIDFIKSTLQGTNVIANEVNENLDFYSFIPEVDEEEEEEDDYFDNDDGGFEPWDNEIPVNVNPEKEGDPIVIGDWSDAGYIYIPTRF
ncbi:hypothetical protein HELRODRAFT_172658 [Helobdella robusta]|uniref:E3 ubiquitin-protein ligase n=1 Tax=Helobdella robusta TaxID=6412 RepID=T1F5Q9_HELRO|nr:hypothetical protein HELRODRAFT_172658 [Helobdella robusta]ESO04302.1 hypothetical protein HELRODRAFT_172658 [Helobdella robusta]